MDTNIKKDRRVEKTTQSIRNAFISLINEKDISQITIKELAERANINRKTFYMHYTSVNDILKGIEDEIIDKIIVIVKQFDFTNSNFDIYALFRSINDIINADLEVYEQLVYANSYTLLITRLKKIFRATLIENYSQKLKLRREYCNFYAEYIASGVLSLYVEWFKDNQQLSLEELAAIAADLTYNGVKPLLVSD